MEKPPLILIRINMLKQIMNPGFVTEAWTFSDATVRIYRSTAIVRCVSDLRNGPPGNVTDSRTLYLWVLLQGPQGWQVVAGQRVFPPKPKVPV